MLEPLRPAMQSSGLEGTHLTSVQDTATRLTSGARRVTLLGVQKEREQVGENNTRTTISSCISSFTYSAGESHGFQWLLQLIYQRNTSQT